MASMSVELPEDILMPIFAGLEVPDLVRAGSVCSSWHGAYTSLVDLGRCKQQQTPCLLYTAKTYGASAAGLYSLTEKKQYRLALPDPPVRSRYLIGAAHGWIITVDDRSELHLVNPITGDQIALPSITTIDLVTPIYDENGALKEYYSWPALPGGQPPSIFGLCELRNYFFSKAFLSSDPSTGSYIVVLIHNTHWQLSFARGGDDCWTRLPPHDFFADCVFKDKLMYAVTKLGGIHVFDFSGPAVEQKVVLENVMEDYYESYTMYIVQAPSGDLLQILMEGEEEVPELDPTEEDDHFSEPEIEGPYPLYTPVYKVYRVDLTAKKIVEISSLDENVLFLGLGQSLCLRADEYPELKANHVYFTDDDKYMKCLGKNERRSIGVLNLSNNSIEKIVSPRIWSYWPSPLWITPNPRKMMLWPGSNIEGRMESGPTAMPEVTTGGKTSSLSKVAVKIESYLFGLIDIFIFGLLGKIRSIGCSIVKKSLSL